MIIYGTRNYYKHDSAYHFDHCRSCGRLVSLHSYNAKRFFHVYWIPLIPAGKMRVLDACPACRASREVRLKDWTLHRESNYEPLLRLVRTGNVDETQADDLLVLIRRSGTKAEFVAVAPKILSRYSQNASLLAKLGWLFFVFGMRDEAVATMNRSLELEEDEDVRSLLDEIGSLSRDLPRSPSPPGRVGQLAPILIVPAVIVAALAVGLWKLTMDRPDRVYMVNGLDRDYRLIVDGAPIVAPAQGSMKLSVDYGEVRIEPADDSGLALEPFTVNLEAGFFDRLDDDQVFVINPDRTALVVKEDVVYVEEGYAGADADALENRYTYLAGETFYSFDDVLEAFDSMPESIELSTGSRFSYRTHIEQISGIDQGQVADVLLNTMGRDAAISYAHAGLSVDPDNESLLALISWLEEPSEVIAFLETRLDERPVLVSWHRYYQSVSMNWDPERDLESVYRALLEEETENADLTYLLARVTSDPKRALALYEDGMRADEPSAFAFHGAAYYYMTQSEYARALSLERKAVEMAPQSALLTGFEEDLLLATGQIDELIGRREAEAENDGFDEETAGSLLFLYAIRGDTASAGQLIREYVGMPEDYEDESARAAAAAVLSRQAEGSRDLSAYARLAAQVAEPEWQYEAATARGDLDVAGSLIDDDWAGAAMQHLLLYVMASSRNEHEAAAEQLREALQVLGKSSTYDPHLADWLSADGSPPSLDAVYRSTISYSHYPVVLAALAFRHPGSRGRYLQSARRANYDPSFPGLLLDDLFNNSPN